MPHLPLTAPKIVRLSSILALVVLSGCNGTDWSCSESASRGICSCQAEQPGTHVDSDGTDDERPTDACTVRDNCLLYRTDGEDIFCVCGPDESNYPDADEVVKVASCPPPD